MSEVIFSAPPQIPLLQWLARGSLKQNLLRAVRLWVWLHTYYGEYQPLLQVRKPFTFTDWRDAFFSSNHPKGEAIPNCEDPHCPCAKTTADWLFDAKAGASEPQWRRSLTAHDHIPHLDELLSRRLFAVTRRSLLGDLQILTEIGWFKRQKQHYYQVSQFPDSPIGNSLESHSSQTNPYTLNFLHPELAHIAQRLSQSIGGTQRFFLHVDYIIPKNTVDRVDDWQEELKQLWEQIPIPPIQLIYKSARIGKNVKCIVYPVCISYMQRSVYLCAFGETPTKQGEWYNYRLDRIERMKALKWNNDGIPQLLLQRYPYHLPTPDYIQVQMAQAWGFDFYLEPRLMLLRFDKDFDTRYIQGTDRHDTFQAISYQKAQKNIQQLTPDLQQQQALLKVWEARSPTDSYYQVYYREGDTNVGLRLRSWRPNAEVLFPYNLRQSLAQEVARELQLYQD